MVLALCPPGSGLPPGTGASGLPGAGGRCTPGSRSCIHGGRGSARHRGAAPRRFAGVAGWRPWGYAARPGDRCQARRGVPVKRSVCQPEKRKVDSSILSLTTTVGRVSSALTSVNADPAPSYLQPSSDHDCPCMTVVGRSLSHADRTAWHIPSRHAPHPLPAPSGPGCGSWSPPLPPIGLTAAGLFAEGEVSRADSRVRSPGTLTCARCPAVRSALDAVPEAYDNPAAVWWGPLQLPRSTAT